MATNGIGWCVEALFVNGWSRITGIQPTREEADELLPYWANFPFETRVYEVLA